MAPPLEDRAALVEAMAARFAGLGVGLAALIENARRKEQLAVRLAAFRSHVEAGGSDGAAIAAQIADRLFEGIAVRPHGWPPALRAIGSVQRFCDLPFMTKAGLVDAPLAHAAPDHGAIWAKTSSGTSGRPVTVPYTTDFYLEYLYLSAIKTAVANGLPLNRDRPIHCLRFVDDPAARPMLFLDASGLSGPVLRLGFDTGSTAAAAAVLAFVATHRPSVVSAKPGILAGLVEIAQARGIGPLPVDLVLSGGAALDALVAARAARLFAAPVRSVYGLSETGVVAYGCAHGRYHVDTSAYHVETRPIAGSGGDRAGTDENRPVTGEAELVVSTLANAAMPMIRYRTGDRGTIARGPCPCGRTGRTIAELRGRIVPRFHFSNGRSVLPSQLLRTLAQKFATLDDHRIEQQAEDLIHVLIDPGEAVDEAEVGRLAASVGHYCRERLPPGIRVTVERRRLVPGDKQQRYRCLIAAPSGAGR